MLSTLAAAAFPARHAPLSILSNYCRVLMAGGGPRSALTATKRRPNSRRAPAASFLGTAARHITTTSSIARLSFRSRNTSRTIRLHLFRSTARRIGLRPAMTPSRAKESPLGLARTTKYRPALIRPWASTAANSWRWVRRSNRACGAREDHSCSVLRQRDGRGLSPGGRESLRGLRVSSCAHGSHACACGAFSMAGKFASWRPAFAWVKKLVITTRAAPSCQIS